MTTKYTTAQLCEKYDSMTTKVKSHGERLDKLETELESTDQRLDESSEANLEATSALSKFVRDKVYYKTIQIFKEVFGDPDSGRRGLAKSHREADQKIDNILSLIKQFRMAYVVSAALVIAFGTAVYKGGITLEFLTK